MTEIRKAEFSLDLELKAGLDRFITARDEPPQGRMSTEDAINVIVRDWLMGQGYLPLPGERTPVKPALNAARTPR